MAHTLAYSTSRGGNGRDRLIRAVHAAALVFPLLPPAAEYGAYLLAWVKLGARPVPLLNDPEVLGPAYYLSVLPLLLMPAGWMLALCSAEMLWVHGESRGRVVTRAMLLVMLWAAAIAFMRWDPWRVGEWWWD
jgi:hypothetical protein